MKKTYFFLGVVGLILISAIVLRLTGSGNEKLVDNSSTELDKQASTSDIISTSTSTSVIPDNSVATFSSTALVVSPKQNEIIISPVKVQGTVVGNWFFEGVLPVKLVDDNNNVIASGQATAETDWMTEKPVNFTASLDFSTKATSGALIISRDNPSGLAQNDGFIKVPVRFK
jgi:cytoskeletal protein RodZ